ncbi:hypothetical protein [Isoptericola croceus]|uniref:hypothetical protein n=1 Tax=Isoptericola croceus TaxID=3031406 RepID=UPI0023F71AD2|nr:hypothetical protein [Isoptericola croceus]
MSGAEVFTVVAALTVGFLGLDFLRRVVARRVRSAVESRVRGAAADRPSWAQAPATKQRPARRRKWLWAPAGVVVPILLAVGLQLTFAPSVSSWGRQDYLDGDLSTAVDRFRAQAEGVVPQQWKADYNLGTALAAQAGDEDREWLAYEASGFLKDAYAGAVDESPEVRCAIVTNWASALEISGDAEMAMADGYAEQSEEVAEEIAKRDAGEPYDEEVIDPYGEYGDELDPTELRERADLYYSFAENDFQRAQEVRALPDCAESSQSQDATAAQERAAEKEEQAHGAQTENQNAPEPQPEPATPEEAEAQRQEALGERNEQAAQDVELDEAEARELGGSGADGDEGEDSEGDDETEDGEEGDGEGPGSLPRNW